MGSNLTDYDSPAPAGAGCFATTHWSVVAAAGQDCPAAREALETLCRVYWYPLYAYIRRRGYTPEDAQDLTQGFFAQLLRKNYPARGDPAKGRFRTFLLHNLNHFLLDQRKHAGAVKRGGRQAVISLEQYRPEERYQLEIPDPLTPEKLFDRHWAQTILDRALARLREEFAARDGDTPSRLLEYFEPGAQNALSYQEAAAHFGLSEGAVKSLVHRLRMRHGELVREEVAQTVPALSNVDEELRYLVSVLRNAGG